MRAIATVFVLSALAMSAAAQDSNTASAARGRVNAAADAADEPEDAAAAEGDVSEAAFGGSAADGAPAPAPAADDNTPSGAPEVHTVQPGDTLWNLSQRFLNNPWYWPKIWSYNQNLDNPNWVYPGSQIRFYPGDAVVVAPVTEEDEQEFEEIDVDLFEGDGVADRFRNVGADRRRRDFFVPVERLEEAGQVLNSPEEKSMLTITDHIYVKLKKAGKPGDVLQVFRATRDLRHPVTGANLGKIVTLLGEVRIDLLSREQALATIVQSWNPVERGDYVAVLPVATAPIRSVENTKAVKAYVVDTGPSQLKYVGDNYVVLLDKGSADGVQIGNSFTVVRAGDPVTKEYSGLADQDVGEILIIETTRSVSTGILMQASREVGPGDRAEMRVR